MKTCLETHFPLEGMHRSPLVLTHASGNGDTMQLRIFVAVCFDRRARPKHTEARIQHIHVQDPPRGLPFRVFAD